MGNNQSKHSVEFHCNIKFDFLHPEKGYRGNKYNKTSTTIIKCTELATLHQAFVVNHFLSLETENCNCPQCTYTKTFHENALKRLALYGNFG
jgi:hypothetical protein